MKTQPEPHLAQAFLDALAHHDLEALGTMVDHAVRFRALVPGETIAVGSAIETGNCIRSGVAAAIPARIGATPPADS